MCTVHVYCGELAGSVGEVLGMRSLARFQNPSEDRQSPQILLEKCL
jgi:hypothetical protein